MPKKPRATLCLDEYDCIGFDLDHTLCRYNVGPMIRLEYDLLAEFLVAKKGYDPAIRAKPFDADRRFVCKGLTLDCDKGNLLRLGHDGFILGKYGMAEALGTQRTVRFASIFDDFLKNLAFQIVNICTDIQNIILRRDHTLSWFMKDFLTKAWWRHCVCVHFAQADLLYNVPSSYSESWQN